jgi:hypothetical protein
MSSQYKDIRQLSPATSRASDGQPQIQPPPELQRLYNQMRELEESLSFDQRLQAFADENALDGPPLPATPQSSTMSRSVSHGSSQSATAGVQVSSTSDGDNIDGSKPKLGRRGPLSQYAKAQANFVRKLKACPSCKQRKVKVGILLCDVVRLDQRSRDNCCSAPITIRLYSNMRTRHPKSGRNGSLLNIMAICNRPMRSCPEPISHDRLWTCVALLWTPI